MTQSFPLEVKILAMRLVRAESESITAGKMVCFGCDVNTGTEALFEDCADWSASVLGTCLLMAPSLSDCILSSNCDAGRKKSGSCTQEGLEETPFLKDPRASEQGKIS